MITAIMVLSIALVVVLFLTLILAYAVVRLHGQIDYLDDHVVELGDKVNLQQSLVFRKYGEHLPFCVRDLERQIGELSK